MAYNNGFPMNYQYQYNQPQFQQPIPTPQVMPQQQMQQQPQNVGGLIWVQGEAGAKSYLVAPNTTVQLWDSENPVIYLKSADVSGMPSMKILDYTIREGEKPQNTPLKNDPNNYATKEELNAFRSEILQTIEKVKGELGA